MKRFHSFGVWLVLLVLAVLAFPGLSMADPVIGGLGSLGGLSLLGFAGFTEYGDISPRTAAYAISQLQKRGIPYLVIEKFGQTYVVPQRKSKVASFRRYEALDTTPNALTEGVTPAGKQLTKTDINATLVQYGDLVTLSDVVLDTHEDPVLNEALEILGEQAAQMIEIVRFGILKAGTNVFFPGTASQRSDVDGVITTGLQRQITRALARQNARRITKTVRSTASYGTSAIAPAYVAMHHPDLEGDIRGLFGFRPPEDYGQMTPWESETGKCETVRYVSSTIFEAWADAGGANANLLATTNPAVAIDVYPILYVARDAYGIVPLKGKNSLTPMVVNPKPSDSDPLAQRGHASWKSMQTAVILNDLWMVRAEVGATTNPEPS